MFDESIVTAKCPYLDWGLDGNHAACVRYSPFSVEYPDCSKCDVYKELSSAKVVE